jgi:hypothetical protein
LISAVITISYAGASQIDIEITEQSYYGFSPPVNNETGAISASGSANGITLSADGTRITFLPEALYPASSDDAYFVGVLSAHVCGFVKTTSGQPTVFAYRYNDTTLYLQYYEDGAAGSLISALATSGDSMRIQIAYMMRPYDAG